jgi:hypothetical protein
MAVRARGCRAGTSVFEVCGVARRPRRSRLPFLRSLLPPCPAFPPQDPLPHHVHPGGAQTRHAGEEGIARCVAQGDTIAARGRGRGGPGEPTDRPSPHCAPRHPEATPVGAPRGRGVGGTPPPARLGRGKAGGPARAGPPARLVLARATRPRQGGVLDVVAHREPAGRGRPRALRRPPRGWRGRQGAGAEASQAPARRPERASAPWAGHRSPPRATRRPGQRTHALSACAAALLPCARGPAEAHGRLARG